MLKVLKVLASSIYDSELAVITLYKVTGIERVDALFVMLGTIFDSSLSMMNTTFLEILT